MPDQRTGNLESIGRLVARELRQTWTRCMVLGCNERACNGNKCRKHAIEAGLE